MNPEQILTHLKKLASTLSAKQLLGLGTAFVAVVAIIVGSAYWISAPNFTLLVSDMDAETAASVVGKLKEGKVPYQLSDGGRTVRVPAERADELRLEFASGGLPSAGRVGFEIFDRPAFGTTEFLEKVNYRRALEGELARTIGTLAEVSSARVHIAMAKDSLFVDKEQSAKASVLLRLKSNRPLSPATVRSIAGLVSSSVESLRPESVEILDTYGRSLSGKSDAGDEGNGADLGRQQLLERDLSTRVISLLEPVVGQGRVRVNVAAYLRSDVVDEVSEKWDPASVIRAQSTSIETSAALSGAGGVAGARANQPARLSTSTAAANGVVPAPPAGAAPPVGTTPPVAGATPPAPGATPTPTPIVPVALHTGAGRTSEITNYEIGRTTRHVITPSGQLARLSVAVILDDVHVVAKDAAGVSQTTNKPREAAEIQRIHGLVAAAVGLDDTRGDKLTVENMAFEVQPIEAEPAEPTTGNQIMVMLKQYWPSALRATVVLGLASFALFGILRPMTRHVAALPAVAVLPVAAARLPTVQELEGQIDADLDASGGKGRKLPVLTKRVAKLASEEPEQLARIVRGWMAEEDR